jgi:predicted phage terminase large subunit-like protein
MNEVELFNHSMRNDFKFFVQVVFEILNPGQPFEDNWHIDLLCHSAMEIKAGRTKRVAIVLPPRSLKSLIFSVALPTYILGHDPTATFLFVSHNMQLTNDLSSDRRKIVMSKRFTGAFPETRISPSKNTEAFFETTAGGSCRATTPGKGVTGLGAKYLFVDDILDAKDANNIRLHAERVDWLHRGFFTRTNRANEAIQVIIGQRLHFFDAIGLLLATGDYESLVIPAIAQQDEVYKWGGLELERLAGDILHPPMLDGAELERRERAMGARDFRAQYLLDPLPDGGGVLKWSWFRPYDKLPLGMLTFQSWDLARTPNGGDFTVCMTIGYWNEQYFILDIFRQQLDYDQVINVMRHKIKTDKPAGVVIETSDGAGYAAYRTLVTDGVQNVYPYKSNKPKDERFYSIVPMLEAGNVFIRANADFIPSFRAEFITFPSRTEHDDQMDALSQFLITAPTLVHRAGGKQPRKFCKIPEFRLAGFEGSQSRVERPPSRVGGTYFDRNRGNPFHG